MKTELIGSAPNEESLLKMAKNYFYGSTLSIQGEEIHNANGKMNNFKIARKGKRVRLERIVLN